MKEGETLGVMDSVIGGMDILGQAVGIGSEAWSAYQNYMNYQQQQDLINYQKNLQQTMFEREDNAVQRRAADLEKAGLSKTLAAGGGAQAGPVVSMKAPESHYDAGAKYMNAVTQSQNIAQSKAQVEMVKAQVVKTLAEARSAEQDALLKEALTQRQITIQGGTMDYYIEAGVRDLAMMKRSGEYASYQKQVYEMYKAKYDAFTAEDLQAIADAKRVIIQTYGLSEADAELVAMQIANRMNTLNLDVFEKTGIPPFLGGQVGNVVGGALKGLMSGM